MVLYLCVVDGDILVVIVLCIGLVNCVCVEFVGYWF